MYFMPGKDISDKIIFVTYAAYSPFMIPADDLNRAAFVIVKIGLCNIIIRIIICR